MCSNEEREKESCKKSKKGITVRQKPVQSVKECSNEERETLKVVEPASKVRLYNACL